MFLFVETDVETKAASCTTECASEATNYFSFIYHHSKTSGVTLTLILSSQS